MTSASAVPDPAWRLKQNVVVEHRRDPIDQRFQVPNTLSGKRLSEPVHVWHNVDSEFRIGPRILKRLACHADKIGDDLAFEIDPRHGSGSLGSRSLGRILYRDRGGVSRSLPRTSQASQRRNWNLGASTGPVEARSPNEAASAQNREKDHRLHTSAQSARSQQRHVAGVDGRSAKSRCTIPSASVAPPVSRIGHDSWCSLIQRKLDA